MANTINSAILESIGIIVDKSIQEAPADRTVTATIVGCINALNNEYKIKFQGGTFTALAAEGETYRANQTVHVLVPEGDFSKVKRIVGLASLVSDDYNITAVGSALGNYNAIGKNTITSLQKDPFGVCSFYNKNYVTLYDRENPSENKITVTDDDFRNSLEDAEAILLEGTFSTNLSDKHRKANGKYGVICVFAYEGEGEDDLSLVAYELTSDKMLGNPLGYKTPVDQYLIFEHDANQKFKHIQQIIFYCEGFVESPPSKDQQSSLSNNIFVKDLELYALKGIDAKNGNYSLSLSATNGITFSEDVLEDILPITANFKKQQVILNTGVKYYWFLEDARVVNSQHQDYNAYAGVGWRKLDNPPINRTINILRKYCSAYRTKFMCVAVAYDTLTLKTEFSLYNEAKNKNIIIELDTITNEFAYNTGKPTLTCKVKDANGKDLDESGNSYYYLWSKIPQDKNEIIFNKTLEEIEEEIKALDPLDLSGKNALELQKIQLDGVEFKTNNSITYPISKIAVKEILKCTVYSSRGENSELLGSAQVELKNGLGTTKSDYYVVVKNGEQVFQYSESGVSPISERNQEPLEILPLEAILYAPDGSEIKNQGINTYTVFWQFPVDSENSLLEYSPKETEDLLESDQCTFSIKDNYDSQAYDNQIICIVDYRGMKITGSTNFLFTKIGEDGTNGTDFVAKINSNQNPEIATIFLDKNNKYYRLNESTGTLNANPVKMELKLFQRNQKVPGITPSWKWSTATSSSKTLLGCTEGELSIISPDLLNDDESNLYLILQGSTIVDRNTYYAHYGIPVVKNHNIEYNSNTTQSQFVADNTTYIRNIDRKSLRDVLYNRDGKNPIYNDKVGVTFNFSHSLENYTIFAETRGNHLNLLTSEGNVVKKLGEDKMSCTFFVTPSDSYSGNSNNNLIYIKVMAANKTVSEAWVPIHFSLNIYGLASLNAWDGNHIDINENDQYIMAPQVGAGEKNIEDNTFTGLVMGKAQFGEEKEQIGLFGLSSGRQSIFLDANTGAATFGLSDEDYENIANKDENGRSSKKDQNCGRIHLDPEGESYISSWRIGRKSLYSVNGTLYDSKTPLEETFEHHPKGAVGSIPRELQGIILSSDPAFISVKGMPAVDQIEIDDKNFYRGDSYEVLLDANNSSGSVFSVLEHTAEVENASIYQIKESNEGHIVLSQSEGDTETIIGTFEVNISNDPNANGIELIFEYKNSIDTDVKDFVLPVPIEVEVKDLEIDLFKSSWKFLNAKYKKDNAAKPLKSIVYILDSNGSLTKISRCSENSEYLYSKEGKLLKESTGKQLRTEKPREEISGFTENIDFNWHAKETAGLDAEGNLNANTVGRDDVNLKVGYVPAFGYSEKTKKYLGLNLSYDKDSFYRTFVSSSSKDNNTLYISAVDRNNDFGKRMNFNAKDFTLSTANLTEAEIDKSFGYQFLNEKASVFGNFSYNKKEDQQLSGSTIEEYLTNKQEDFLYYYRDENEYILLTSNDLYLRDGEKYMQSSRTLETCYIDAIDSSITKIDTTEYYPQYKLVDIEVIDDAGNTVSEKLWDLRCKPDNPTFNFPSASFKDLNDESNKGTLYFKFDSNHFKTTPQDLRGYSMKDDLVDYSTLAGWVVNNKFFIPKLDEYSKVEYVGEKILAFDSAEIYIKLTNGKYISLFGTKDNIVKKKIFDIDNIDFELNEGSFLHLDQEKGSQLYSLTPLNIQSEQNMSIKSKRFSLTGSGLGGLSLVTERINNPEDFWILSMSPNIKDEYGAKMCNNKTGKEKEGIFFTGRRSGAEKSSLFTYKGLTIQNASCDLGSYARRSFAKRVQGISTNIQDIGGGGLSLAAIPSSLSKDQTTELRLWSSKAGFSSRFELLSPAGDIYSLYGKWPRLQDQKQQLARQVIVSAPLRVYSKGTTKTTYHPVHCGGIATHLKNITTGHQMGSWDDPLKNSDVKGGSIHTRGGSISTNGGNINTIKGNINTQGGNINTSGGDINLKGGNLNIGGVIQGTGNGVHLGGTLHSNYGANFSGTIKANDFFI